MAEKDKAEEAIEPINRLDAKSIALQAMLPGIVSDFKVTINTAFDLVVVAVEPEEIKQICLLLRDNDETAFDYLLLLCVVDYEDYLQVVYHIYSTSLKHTLVVKTNVSPEEPSLESVTPVWKGADWYEREAHDLFGVSFNAHPSLSPLLLYEGFEGFPGRRNYEMPEYKEW
ncbi:MAG: NADH-quinone oxidoreductase subunit C [SAR202 cluster bacterium]|nr:NADH-quinone oxidoreductase subunit C [SAR202 cluster bacterium]